MRSGANGRSMFIVVNRNGLSKDAATNAKAHHTLDQLQRLHRTEMNVRLARGIQGVYIAKIGRTRPEVMRIARPSSNPSAEFLMPSALTKHTRYHTSSVGSRKDVPPSSTIPASTRPAGRSGLRPGTRLRFVCLDWLRRFGPGFPGSSFERPLGLYIGLLMVGAGTNMNSPAGATGHRRP